MDYSKYSTVTQTNSGSWAAHVISRINQKKVLLGTYNTEQDAKLAIDKYAHPEKYDASPSKADFDDNPPAPPKQGSLF